MRRNIGRPVSECLRGVQSSLSHTRAGGRRTDGQAATWDGATFVKQREVGELQGGRRKGDEFEDRVKSAKSGEREKYG